MQPPGQGAPVVIVHGAFGGGWEWDEVAVLLRRSGHLVRTPTLTGLGDRAHLATPETDLETHVQDLVALLEGEGLEGTVLCAASYGGMPATGAADRLAGRVRGLVYVDALVPRDGQSARSLLPESFATALRPESGSFRVAVPPVALPPRGSITADRWSGYVRRLVGQPVRTFNQPIRLSGAVDGIPKAFVRCTRSVLPDDPIGPMATRARREGWLYRELEAPHDPHLFEPGKTAGVLDELVRSLAGIAPKRS